MKRVLFILNLSIILFLSSFSLQAVDEGESLSLRKSKKRRHSEITTIASSEEKSEPRKSKRRKAAASPESAHRTTTDNTTQIYSIPTYDATFKYMLSDQEVCLSFLKTFTLTLDIESVERLDEHLNPVQGYQVARQLINDPKSINLMNRINGVKDKDLRVVYEGCGGTENEVKNGSWFLSRLSKVYKDILDSFPTPERNSTVDVLCRLNDGSHALIEVQVVEQDYWDQRALAYAANIYSRQMKRGDKWDKIKSVICINILGGGSKSVQWDSPKGFRHYRVKDQNNISMDGGIEIFQYPLYYGATVTQASEKVVEETQRLALREWMDFLEHASGKKEVDVAEVKTHGLKKAYEMVRVQTLPSDVKEKNERQEEEIFKASARVIKKKERKAHKKGKLDGKLEGIRKGIRKGKREGKREGEEKLREAKKAMARKLLEKGLSVEDIRDTTDLSVSDIEKL